MSYAERVLSSLVTSSLATVNKALRQAGIKDKLVKGKDYYYFVGDATTWPDNSVHTYRVDDLSPERWVEEYRRLEKEADPELQHRLNEERYFPKKQPKK
jgi:hypothetical protein